MKRIAAATALFSFVSVSASAQFMRAQGTFSSDSAELTTILLDKEKGVIAASAEVVQGACSDSLSGIGTIKGKTVRLEPYTKLPGSEKCALEITFSPDWKKAKLVEVESCSAYHGASCGWEGQEVKRKPNQ
jgi:hypothetical protein